ncbi:uncharacterized protein LOC116933363 [Daphnia magna]|uniref:Uncharacterized protein n=1 Tax=Daphnia magna TaxID=35525 RepID=A0A0P4WVW2_9CRUS|nr:uncharacterized protein LOC116933363 [Daphnia magna]KAK4026996.1 hypothetical protein OUZ56_016016 [Daphnia magna]
MAFKRPASVSLLLIVSACCLMGVIAEEEQPSASVATGDREGKQIFFVPQPYPAESPLYYQDSYAYRANPFAVSSPQLPFFNRNEEAGVPAWPWTYPSLSLGHPSYAAWRVNDGIDDKDKLKWWKKRFNRQAVITILPAPQECLIGEVEDNGLGPCKRATDAHHGTLEVRLQRADQTAAIAITSKSPMNTRIRLICTDLNAVAVFTNTGRITAVSDTPRTEIGQMQLIVTSTADNGLLKCNWRSYSYYTAAFP